MCASKIGSCAAAGVAASTSAAAAATRNFGIMAAMVAFRRWAVLTTAGTHAAADAQRVSGAARRARLVRDLLGEEPLRHHRRRQALRAVLAVLDEARLSDSRQPVRLRGARDGAQGHRADPPH